LAFDIENDALYARDLKGKVLCRAGGSLTTKTLNRDHPPIPGDAHVQSAALRDQGDQLFRNLQEFVKIFVAGPRVVVEKAKMFDPRFHSQFNALKAVGMPPVLLGCDSVEKGVLGIEDEQISSIKKPNEGALLFICFKLVLRVR
jgi:hypothetical protein